LVKPNLLLIMYRIIYLSSAVKYLSDEEIGMLLKQSRNRNRENNISGVLLYIEGDFLQVIEGEKEAIENIFENIKKDSRHKGIICVFNQKVEKREFPDWSMGFYKSNYENLRKICGFENLNKKELFTINDKTVSIFLSTFIKSRREKIDLYK
jgi:hypothetical protein